MTQKKEPKLLFIRKRENSRGLKPFRIKIEHGGLKGVAVAGKAVSSAARQALFFRHLRHADFSIYLQ